jgi:DNA polymerase III subunit epsilon
MEETARPPVRWAGRTPSDTGPDLRAGWRDAEYCAVDVETTGLDLWRDSVVSIGSACIRDGRIVCSENYYSLVRPACPVSPASVRIHSLRAADLAGSPAPHEVGRQIASRLAGRVLVAHAAWVERTFLTRLLRQAGMRFSSPVIDTAALARALRCAPGTQAGYEPSLELLARRLSLPAYAPHHALGDAVTTAVVFLALATRAAEAGQHGSARPASLRALLELSAKHAA